MKKLITLTATAGLILTLATQNSFARSSNNLDLRIKELEKKFERLSAETADIKASDVVSILGNAKVFGRLQVDANWYNEKQATDNKSDGIDIARARLGIKGKLSKNVKYKFENDFSENASEIKDAYLAYTGFKNSTITFGQTKPTFSLEILESSNHMAFIQRSLAEDSVLGRKVGVKADKYGKNWRIAAGVFGESVGNESRTDDSQYSATARATISPINSENALLHLGVATSYSSKDRGNAANSDIETIDKQHLIGGELIARYKALTLQGEYIVNDSEYDSDSGTGDNVNFTSYYLQATLGLTGEHRAYSKKAAKLGKLKVKRVWGKGGMGAFELAARFSHLDKNDQSVIDGRTNDYTLGVNWYPTDRVRVMLNYLKSESEYASTKNSVGHNAVSLRTRVYF